MYFLVDLQKFMDLTNLICRPGFERDSRSDKCQLPGTCDPSISISSCDERKREQCLPDRTGQYTCQCPKNYRRHPVTEICCNALTILIYVPKMDRES